MLARKLAQVATVAAVASGMIVAATGAHASTPPACDALECLWSGPNYTGTKAEIQVARLPQVRRCSSAASLGMDAIRSAVLPVPNVHVSTGDKCENDVIVGDVVPVFDPPIRSLSVEFAQGGA